MKPSSQQCSLNFKDFFCFTNLTRHLATHRKQCPRGVPVCVKKWYWSCFLFSDMVKRNCWHEPYWRPEHYSKEKAKPGMTSHAKLCRLPLISVLQKHRAFTTLTCGRIFYVVYTFKSLCCFNQSLTRVDADPVKQENKNARQTVQIFQTRKIIFQVHNIRCIWTAVPVAYSSDAVNHNFARKCSSPSHLLVTYVNLNCTQYHSIICILGHKCNFSK